VKTNASGVSSSDARTRDSSRRATGARILALVAGCVIGFAACSSAPASNAGAPPPAGSLAPATAATPSSDPTGSAVGSRGASGIGHVFIINLENESYDVTFGPGSKATYLNATLVPQGKLLSQYHGIGHASLDNYLAQISGQAPNPATQTDCAKYIEFAMTATVAPGQAVGTGCVYPASVKTIADQLTEKGLRWKGYMEDMGNDPNAPTTCRHPAIGARDSTLLARSGDQYATRHNPFVYFHSIIDSPACATNDVALDALPADLASLAATPNYTYITPSLCHDGHDTPCANGEPGGLTSADAFLAQWVPRILASPAYQQDGALIVTFDEADQLGPNADSSACCGELTGPNTDKPGINGPGGGRVGAVVLSRFTTPGTTSTTAYNHYSLLCSTEQIFAVDRLGMAAQSDLPCFGRDVFDRPQGA